MSHLHAVAAVTARRNWRQGREDGAWALSVGAGDLLPGEGSSAACSRSRAYRSSISAISSDRFGCFANKSGLSSALPEEVSQRTLADRLLVLPPLTPGAPPVPTSVRKFFFLALERTALAWPAEPRSFADGSDEESSACDASSDEDAARSVIGLAATACAFDRKRARSRSSSATSLASTAVSILVLPLSF